VLGRDVFLRLRRALLPDVQRVWTRDVEASFKDVRDSLADIKSELTELRRFRKRIALREWANSRAVHLPQAEQLSRGASPQRGTAAPGAR
jgi:hypothetical protein